MNSAKLLKLQELEQNKSYLDDKILNEKDVIFSSIIFCYFLDSGPCSVDLYSLNEIKESPDLTAVRLMTKSTALVRGDSTQQVEMSIIDQLSGPDIYPVDTNYRMVWYNWLIANKYSNDPRIKDSGAIAGIYCIYNRKNETIIRNSLEIIEQILRNASKELCTIDDIIRKKLQLTSSTSVKKGNYADFLKEKDSDIITKDISKILNAKVREYSQKYNNKRISQSRKFKIILQSMIFKKGTSEEIVDQSEKRIHWNSVIEKIDQLIKERKANLKVKKIDMNELREVYQLLVNEKGWNKLLIGELHPLIQTKDVADFFFYYWLAYHKLLKKKKNLKLYIEMTK